MIGLTPYGRGMFGGMEHLPYVLEPAADTRQRVFTIVQLLERTSDPAERADLASELVAACAQYEDVITRAVYPAVLDDPDNASQRAVEDEDVELRELLGDIRSRTLHVKPAYVHADDPQGFEGALAQLVDAIHVHIGHQDRVLFGELDRLDARTATGLRSDVQAAVAHASTHPDPPHSALGRAFVAVEEFVERKVKDESTPWHPGKRHLDEALGTDDVGNGESS
jgi:hypothetical protein